MSLKSVRYLQVLCLRIQWPKGNRRKDQREFYPLHFYTRLAGDVTDRSTVISAALGE